MNDAAVDAELRDLGHHLAALRKRAGYSQTELARKVAYARSIISDAENGRRNMAASAWAAIDSVLDAKGVLINRYERISVRRDEIRATRAATRAAERAAARQAGTAARSTIAAVLSAAAGPRPVPAIAAIVIIWRDGTTTTATPPVPVRRRDE